MRYAGCFSRLILFFIAACPVLFVPSPARGQAFQGYTLFSPNNSRNTYLVNMSNTVVHSWTHNRNGGYSAYLLEDGSVLRPALSSNSPLGGGGEAGIVQKVSWSGTLQWEYTYSSTTYRTHHDIEPMPNGNVLLIAWEVKTAAQAIQAGLNHSAAIWPDHIVEVQPVGSTGGNIVWQWHAWDHLIQDYDPAKDNYGVVANHPELLDINVESSGSGDWLHINGISYNPELDQIVISSHELDEIYVIDHSTTTAEAAGHTGGLSGMGGDILYRWGRPANYDAPGAQVFNVVHCAYWVPGGLPGAGNIMAFNNREGQPTSMVVELVPPYDSLGHYSRVPGTAFGPASPIWSHTETGFFSNHLGGCQRLPNGNTFIVESTSGYMFEVNAAGVTQWSYNRGGEIARALRYGTDYAGLAGLGLGQFVVTPGSVSFGEVAVSSTLADSVTVRNTGAGSMTISGMALNNTTDFGVTETVPINVAPGDSVRLHITFHPQSAGVRTGDIVFTHSGSTSPDTVDMDGSGTATQFSASPSAVMFGQVPVGTEIAESLSVRNSGSPALTISGIALSDSSVFHLAEAGPVVLATGESAWIHVSFHPVAPGMMTSDLIFLSTATSSPDTIPVQGTGTLSVEVGVHLSAGWNMVSNPVETPGDSVRQLYPTSLFEYAFGFDPTQGYLQRGRLAAGTGYWAKFPAAVVNTITGDMRTRDTVGIQAGWNMLGSMSAPVDTAAVVWIPAGLRASEWFGYGPSGLAPVAQLSPGKAYWIKATGPGACILVSSVKSRPALSEKTEGRSGVLR
jgi:hypothetical protein